MSQTSPQSSDPRSLIRYACVALAVTIVLMWALYLVRAPLLLIYVSALFATGITPLVNFIGTWNDFLNPLIYLNDQSKFTLTLGLYSFLGDHGSQWQLLYASAVLITIPPLVLFFFAQKTFIQGIALSGIKG